ncbi:MAG: hypothetical protein ACJ71R_19445 [Nitrososphaeraceae archaeon]
MKEPDEIDWTPHAPCPTEESSLLNSYEFTTWYSKCVFIDPNGYGMLIRIDNSTLERYIHERN